MLLTHYVDWPSFWPILFLLANLQIFQLTIKGKLFPTDLVVLAALILSIFDSLFPQYYMPVIGALYTALLSVVLYLASELLIMQLTVWILEGTWGSFLGIPWDENPYAYCLLSSLILTSIRNEKLRRTTFWTQKLDLLFCTFMWFSPFIFM